MEYRPLQRFHQNIAIILPRYLRENLGMDLLQKCINVKPLLSNGNHNLKHTVFICQGYICIRYDIALLTIGVVFLNQLLIMLLFIFYKKMICSN